MNIVRKDISTAVRWGIPSAPVTLGVHFETPAFDRSPLAGALRVVAALIAGFVL